MSEPVASESTQERRVGEVRGDRMCLACGFNLHGQTILREPHYGLLIVRCPECSAVTSTQEYPVLGRWAKRWGFALAAGYLLLAIAAVLGVGCGLGGFSTVWVYEVQRELSHRVAAEHREWHARTKQDQALAAKYPGQGSALATTQSSVNNWGPYAAVSTEWWRAEGREAVLKKQGEGRKISSDMLAGLVTFGVGALVAGAAFAVLFPGLAGARRFAAPALVGAVGALLTLALQMEPPGFGAAFLPGYVTAHELAGELMPPRLTAWVFGGGLALLTLGLFLGRPAARGLVRVLLTPRSAAALSFLWEADGRVFHHRR